MCAAVFHQWLHEYCPLTCQLPLACRRNTYLWRHPTNNGPTVSNRSSEVTKRHLCIIIISSAADNVIYKNRAPNIECSFDCVALIAVLLKPNVANILNFCEQKFVQHGPIPIAIDCYGLSLLIFGEKWSCYDCGSKSAPNIDSFWMRGLFNVCVQVFCSPNAIILLASGKMMFLPKIGIFYKSIAGPLSEAKTYWMVNWLQLLNQLNFVCRLGLYAKFVSIIRGLTSNKPTHCLLAYGDYNIMRFNSTRFFFCVGYTCCILRAD